MPWSSYRTILLSSLHTGCPVSPRPILCWPAPPPSLHIAQCDCPTSSNNSSFMSFSLVSADCYEFPSRCQHRGINYQTGRSRRDLKRPCPRSTIYWNLLPPSSHSDGAESRMWPNVTKSNGSCSKQNRNNRSDLGGVSNRNE